MEKFKIFVKCSCAGGPGGDLDGSDTSPLLEFIHIVQVEYQLISIPIFLALMIHIFSMVKYMI